MRTTLLCASASVIAILISGCGDEATKTVTVPAAPPAAETSPPASTAPAETTPAAAAEPPATEAPATEQTRKDAITVRGRKGDTLALLGQYATSVAGTPKARVEVKVTLKGVRGPFTGFNLAAGHKLIGFDVRITNVGDKMFDDPQPNGTLILIGGENGKPTNLITAGGTNPCPNPSLKLKKGQSAIACMAFDVPKNAKLQTFQYATDSGFGDTGLWRLT